MAGLIRMTELEVEACPAIAALCQTNGPTEDVMSVFPLKANP
jgi:hypothetical protein